MNNRRNPYIIGTPIINQDQLFGREILLRTIEDSLQQNAKFILLHGQRRIGKSSVLRNIPLFVSQDEFVFVPCDFQEYGYSTLGEILYAIANAIVESLKIDSTVLSILDTGDLDNNPRILTRRLLPKVYEKLGDKKLVLLLDEFDVVTQNNTEQALQLLQFLQKLVTQEEELFVIAVVGRYLNFMPNLLRLFREAPSQEISLLDYENAERLITKPAQNILQYSKKTIEEILKFSAGHPFYTQVLCYAIFNQARNEGYSTVIPASVSDVLNQAIESAEGGLASIWDGLSIPEKIVLSVVAEAQRRNTPGDYLKILEVYGLVLTDSLEQAIPLLINKGFLDNSTIKVKVELVRLWLLQRHKFRDEFKSLETLDEENVEQLLSVARSCWIGDKQQDAALAIYEQVLQLNPNHFSTIVELGEKYLHLENFDKALKLYERVYKVDPAGYKQELVQALTQYGQWLINHEDYEKAKQQYNIISTIEPGSSLAKQKLIEIKDLQAKKNNISSNQYSETIKLAILLISVVLIGSAGSLVFRSLLSKSCPAGQEKNLGIFCKEIIDSIRISRGDRTLFPSIPNSDRDKGIDSFKKGNYTQAAVEFKDAVNKNRNDPEVLIYQNNAFAIQQGNPLTIAAVVPATNRTDLAQEVLRGIAQAQNQFNNNKQGKGGLNGRLLEIVIADDGGQEGKAIQVANELVKDQSLLGVIGHFSSKVTNKALPIYTKANLAIVSPTSTSIELQSPVFFRTLPSDKATGEKLAKYALEKKFKKIVIFCNPDNVYSRSLKEEFRLTFFKNQREKVVTPSCINLADPDLNVAQEVQNLLLGKPPAEAPADAIALFPDTDHVEVAIDIAKKCKEFMDNLRNLRNSNSNIQQLKLLGGDSLYRQEVADAVEGLVLAVPWFRDAPKSNRFAQEAEKQWGGGVSWRTATSFDATQAFIESFKLSPKVSKATVLENLPSINLSSNNTSGEELKFVKSDSSREINKEATLIMVKGGRFVNANEK